MTASTALHRSNITERLINAPRELVFRAWTEPEHIAQWWGPDGFSNTIHEMDVRPGGHWRFVMHGPDGTDYNNHSVFVEIRRPELIVFDHVSTPKFRSTVTFSDEGGKTRLRMVGEFEDVRAYEMAVKTFGAVEGGRQTLGRMASFVESGGAAGARWLDLGPMLDASLQEKDGIYTVTLVRELPHPRERVWAVLTDPDHLKEWSPFVPDRNLGAVGKVLLTMYERGAIDSMSSTITRAEAPSVLEYTWAEDVLRWELEPTKAGTRLTLRHTMKDKSFLAGVSAGWHICLVVAGRLLLGRPFGLVTGREAKKHGWDGLNEAYATKLGVEKMPTAGSEGAVPPDQPFTITRKLKAPRALVWKMWSDPAHFAQWWGPSGCTVAVKTMAFRPGGVAHYSMTFPEQPSSWGRFVFGTIEPEVTIEFTNAFANEAGEAIRADFDANWPLEMLNTLTLTEESGETTFLLKVGPNRGSEKERSAFVALTASMTEGFGGTFDRLSALLARIQSN